MTCQMILRKLFFILTQYLFHTNKKLIFLLLLLIILTLIFLTFLFFFIFFIYRFFNFFLWFFLDNRRRIEFAINWFKPLLMFLFGKTLLIKLILRQNLPLLVCDRFSELFLVNHFINILDILFANRQSNFSS